MADERVYNFSAGPAILPESVLKQAADEMLSYKGSGMGIMEQSHRGKMYQGVQDAAEANVRKILNVPDDYHVLFMQGGASLQFSCIPLNLGFDGKGDYIVTGTWSGKSAKEAEKYTDVKVVWKKDVKDAVPTKEELKGQLRPDASYVYLTVNETIQGLEFFDDLLPETGDVPIIGDWSSNLFSRPVNWDKYSCIFACTQKNFGPAGLALVIVKDSLVQRKAHPLTPKLLEYKTYYPGQPMFNTPPSFTVYMANLVFEWIIKEGGIEAMLAHNEAKAKLLYDFVDSSDGYYRCPTSMVACRSLMNVPFVQKDKELDADLLKFFAERKIVTIKGHRSVGGFRASMYNAFPLEGTKALIAAMKEWMVLHP